MGLLRLGAFAVACIGTAALVIACGGGTGDSAPPAPAPIPAPTPAPDPNVINGITVPPDPGPSGSTTVTGTDSDNNGVRDDIDRFIATKYGLSVNATKAASTSARARQAVLIADPTSRTAARTALQDSATAGICAGGDFEAAGLDPFRELNEIYLRTYNTPERLAHQKSIAARAGQFTKTVTGVVCR
jgi:hypothetical protein